MSETIQPRQLLSLIWARIWSKDARQQVVQKHRLEFADICPEWNKRFNGLECDGRLDITKCDLCVVGEAWCFSTEYLSKCTKCSEFSRGTDHDFIHYIHHQDYRHDIMESFVQHWNEAHVK